jgi:hypothetical protein
VRIERFANSETIETMFCRSFSGLQIFSSGRIQYRGVSDRLGSPGSTTRTMLEKACPLRRWRCAQSGVYVWLTFAVQSRGRRGRSHGSLCSMADLKMTPRYGLGQARVRALRIVAAYASIRKLSETEFCKLVDDLTIASVPMPPSSDDPRTP